MTSNPLPRPTWHLPVSVAPGAPKEALCGVVLLPTAHLLPKELADHPDCDLEVCPRCRSIRPKPIHLS